MLIGGAVAPHFYWRMLTSEDRDTLIEQSASVNHFNRTVSYTSFKTVSSFYSYIVKVYKILFQSFQNVNFLWVQAARSP